MTYFEARMHQIRFRLGCLPRSRWGAYSAPPCPLARFHGPASKEKGGEERGYSRGNGRRGRGWEGSERGNKGRERREEGDGRQREEMRGGACPTNEKWFPCPCRQWAYSTQSQAVALSHVGDRPRLSSHVLCRLHPQPKHLVTCL